MKHTDIQQQFYNDYLIGSKTAIINHNEAERIGIKNKEYINDCLILVDGYEIKIKHER